MDDWQKIRRRLMDGWKNIKDDWQNIRRGLMAVSILLFAGQCLCLLAMLLATVRDDLPAVALPSILAVQSITAVSGATGLTVALFIWLMQRTSNSEYGVSVGDLFRWTCPTYIWSFFAFAFSTLTTLYLGNHPNRADYIFRVTALGGCTVLGVAQMILMCQCFIFSSKTRHRIAHAFLLSKIKKTSGTEREGWFDLLLASMDTCLKQNNAEGIKYIFETMERFGEQVFPKAGRKQRQSLCYRQQYMEGPDLTDEDREINLFRYYLRAWNKLAAVVDDKKALFRLAYKRFDSKEACIPELVWLYVLTQTKLPPIWPDVEAGREFQFVNYLSTLDHSTYDTLKLDDKDSLLFQFCLFYRLYIKFRAAVRGEYVSQDEEDTLFVLSETTKNSKYRLDEAQYKFLANSAAQMLMINSSWSDKDFEDRLLSPKGMALLNAMEEEHANYLASPFAKPTEEERKEVQPLGTN